MIERAAMNVLIALALTITAHAASAAETVADTFADCTQCPTMVVVPKGEFLMGASVEEHRTEGVGTDYASWEQPAHKVTIARAFAVAKYETTIAEFAAFAAATNKEKDLPCHADFGATRAEFEKNESKTWRNPGFPQTDNDPVVCVGWDEAKAYATWLSQKTGKAYRLPTEAEWEYVTRAGTASARYWGNDRIAACVNANGADHAALRHFGWTDPDRASPCDDGYVFTAPVGTFAPNAFGLYDTLGNAWEWVEDCFVANYDGAPNDGSARGVQGDCAQRVFRGGGWLNSPVGLRAAARGRRPIDGRFNVGFRVVRDIE